MALAPAIVPHLLDPAVRTVLLCGCGGGFDFLHGLTLYPELAALGKKIIIGSYSFGDPRRIGGEAPVVFQHGDAVVKRVTAASRPDPHYGPEVHLASFLDQRFPGTAPHFVYAYYARAFTVPALRSFYQQVVLDHDVDAIVLVDGGSDSLMRGDEQGLGDPVEDAVSVATVSSLEGLKVKALISVGLGADRFNQVSDASSLRAIAELTASGGFRGAASLVKSGDGFRLYRDCIEHVYARQTFRSALSGLIISAVEGHFGGNEVPPLLASRLRPGGFFVWPLMAILWGFDVEAVAARSLIVQWIRDCQKVGECYEALHRGRSALPSGPRVVEDLPRHEAMAFSSAYQPE